MYILLIIVDCQQFLFTVNIYSFKAQIKDSTCISQCLQHQGWKLLYSDATSVKYFLPRDNRQIALENLVTSCLPVR